MIPNSLMAGDTQRRRVPPAGAQSKVAGAAAVLGLQQCEPAPEVAGGQPVGLRICVTNSTLAMVEADQRRRDHAYQDDDEDVQRCPVTDGGGVQPATGGDRGSVQRPSSRVGTS